MATWSDFEAARPEMAAVFRGILDWIPIAYLATVRADGGPRVHPIVPIFAGGRLFVAVIPSPKARDLLRDGRYALHALPGKWDESGRGDAEFYATGRAHLVEDSATRQMVAEAAKHEVREQDLLFELGLERVMTAYWEKVGQPGTYPVRQFWRAGS